MTDLPPQRFHGSDDSTEAPLVSILMPCYNVEDTVDETIESLLRQSFQQFEILAMDDGSTDSTPERLIAWVDRDPRVRRSSLPHRGIIETLNAGLAACNAPLVARMDADDIAHADRIQKQVSFLGAHPEIAAVGSLVEGFPADQVREGFRIYIQWLNALVTPEDIAREIFVESPLVHPSVLIRRSWIDRVDGYQEHGWPEDYDLWLRLHNAGAIFAKVPEVLLYWREHPRRLTRTDSRYSVKNFLRAKAHYLCRGPLRGRDSVIIWGSGQMGRRISKYLLHEGVSLAAFVDIDPVKIGRKRRGRPIIAPDQLMEWWQRYDHPAALAAVGSRGARGLIRERLTSMGLQEGEDWWAVA